MLRDFFRSVARAAQTSAEYVASTSEGASGPADAGSSNRVPYGQSVRVAPLVHRPSSELRRPTQPSLWFGGQETAGTPPTEYLPINRRRSTPAQAVYLDSLGWANELQPDGGATEETSFAQGEHESYLAVDGAAGTDAGDEPASPGYVKRMSSFAIATATAAGDGVPGADGDQAAVVWQASDDSAAEPRYAAGGDLDVDRHGPSFVPRATVVGVGDNAIVYETYNAGIYRCRCLSRPRVVRHSQRWRHQLRRRLQHQRRCPGRRRL